MASDPHEVCGRCGGSGLELGPSSPRRRTKQQKLLDKHSFARHEVFRLIDREIAQQVVPLEKFLGTPDFDQKDLIDEARVHFMKAEEMMQKGKADKSLVSFYNAAVRLIYFLESNEFNSDTIARGPEDKDE